MALLIPLNQSDFHLHLNSRGFGIFVCLEGGGGKGKKDEKRHKLACWLSIFVPYVFPLDGLNHHGPLK